MYTYVSSIGILKGLYDLRETLFTGFLNCFKKQQQHTNLSTLIQVKCRLVEIHHNFWTLVVYLHAKIRVKWKVPIFYHEIWISEFLWT